MPAQLWNIKPPPLNKLEIGKPITITWICRLSGGDKDTVVSSSDEDLDDASIPSNEEHKVGLQGHQGQQHTSHYHSSCLTRMTPSQFKSKRHKA